jgi:hypothetical protein
LPSVDGHMAKVSWRARTREGALSLLALTALVSILCVADYRVRERATSIVSTSSASNVSRVSSQFTVDASKMVRGARDQVVQHAPMTAFLATAGVLLLFMLKS